MAAAKRRQKIARGERSEPLEGNGNEGAPAGAKGNYAKQCLSPRLGLFHALILYQGFASLTPGYSLAPLTGLRMWSAGFEIDYPDQSHRVGIRSQKARNRESSIPYPKFIRRHNFLDIFGSILHKIHPATE